MFALTLSLAACSVDSPPCPFTGTMDEAPSAGCFSASNQGLLLVQGMNGEVSLPGGSSHPGESAQCTAFRETWEETGLRLQPRELLQVFNTGFHLYRCERNTVSGDINPPLRLEVRDAFYLPVENFDSYEWRFEDQKPWLEQLLLNADPASNG
jgi:8-oxo-dGTP diphosphatase